MYYPELSRPGWPPSSGWSVNTRYSNWTLVYLATLIIPAQERLVRRCEVITVLWLSLTLITWIRWQLSTHPDRSDNSWSLLYTLPSWILMVTILGQLVPSLSSIVYTLPCHSITLAANKHKNSIAIHDIWHIAVCRNIEILPSCWENWSQVWTHNISHISLSDSIFHPSLLNSNQ